MFEGFFEQMVALLQAFRDLRGLQAAFSEDCIGKFFQALTSETSLWLLSSGLILAIGCWHIRVPKGP